MKKALALCSLFLIISFESVFGQHRFLKIEDSPYFERVSLYAGIAQAFDHSADDNLRLGLRIPVWQRFHIVVNAGFRHVEPLTLVGLIGFEADIYRSAKQRVKFMTNYAMHYRGYNQLLFDEKFRKTTFGLGVESMLFRRVGAGIEYMPVGFYFGTRKDNPEKGNPSLTGAGEFRVNLFITAFKM